MEQETLFNGENPLLGIKSLNHESSLIAEKALRVLAIIIAIIGVIGFLYIFLHGVHVMSSDKYDTYNYNFIWQSILLLFSSILSSTLFTVISNISINLHKLSTK